MLPRQFYRDEAQLMWMEECYTELKRVCRQTLKTCFSEAVSDRIYANFCSAAEAHGGTADSPEAVLKGIAHGVIAVYRSFLAEKIVWEKCDHFFRKLIADGAGLFAARLDRLSSVPFFTRICRKKVRKHLAGKQPDGWTVAISEEDKKHMVLQVSTCYVFDLLKQEDCLILVPFFCEFERLVLAGMADRVRFRQRQTRGRGDENCALIVELF